MAREVRHVGAPAKGLAIRVIMYLIWQCACSRPQSHHTHRETWRALQPRQRGSALPISTLGPAFLTTWRLLTSTHCPAQPAHRQQPHTARAPAEHRSPIESWPFPRLPPHPPPLEHASPRSKDPTGSVVPSSALRSCCKVTGYALPAQEAPPKSAIPPKPVRSDSAHAYRMVPEAWAPNHYSYAMDTVKDG